MAEQIKVCVLALTHAQWLSLPAAARNQLQGMPAPAYLLGKKGRVYGDAPDDWSPFTDGETIIDLLKSVGSDVIPLSYKLAAIHDSRARDSLIDEVELYIFDPMFLMLGEEFEDFVKTLQGAIRRGGAGVCVIVPQRASAAIREHMCHLRDQKLADLNSIFERGDGEWEANTTRRFKAYLSQFQERKRRPSPEVLQAISRIFAGQGAAVHLPQNPSLASR